MKRKDMSCERLVQNELVQDTFYWTHLNATESYNPRSSNVNIFNLLPLIVPACRSGSLETLLMRSI
jgi:hypothetical protein